jgi:hypothetical protein
MINLGAKLRILDDHIPRPGQTSLLLGFLRPRPLCRLLHQLDPGVYFVALLQLVGDLV